MVVRIDDITMIYSQPLVWKVFDTDNGLTTQNLSNNNFLNDFLSYFVSVQK